MYFCFYKMRRYPVFFYWKRGGPNEYSLLQLLVIFWCANDDSLMFLCGFPQEEKIAHKNGVIAYYTTVLGQHSSSKQLIQ